MIRTVLGKKKKTLSPFPPFSWKSAALASKKRNSLKYSLLA